MAEHHDFKGWKCRRKASHDGPCALDPTFWTRLKLWIWGVPL